MGVRFNLDDYKGDYVMHCKTEEEANSFLEFLHNAGRRWRNGNTYMGSSFYNLNKHNTIYYFNEGEFGNCNYVCPAEFTILEWSDFIWDEDEITDEEFNDMLSNLLGI